MIKKLLSVSLLLIAAVSMNAQSNLVAEPAGPLTKQATIEAENAIAAKSSALTMGDTLWYFFNKHFYRNAAGTGFFTFKSPNTSGASHFGARFNNSNPNLAVTGLECVASRQAGSPTASLTVRMYLCNVVAGLPTLPPLDSVLAVVSSTAGNFYGGNFLTPKFVTGDFAVLYRFIQTTPGDTLRVWMNNANTAASTTTLTASKYGESYGYVGLGASFITTTGAFGAGTDFEFLVAPRVGFTASALQTSFTGTMCTNTAYTFTNNSSFQLGHRQYNLNEFYRVWRPFTNTLTIAADSVYTWNFGDGTGNYYTTSGSPNIPHTYTAAGVYNGTLTAKYQKMADSGVKLQDAATFTKGVTVCTGIQAFSGTEAVNVYPNPSTGIINIANLPVESSIEVVNMLGQSVYKTKSDAGNFTADLSSLSNGSYFIKISAANEKTKIVKLILN